LLRVVHLLAIEAHARGPKLHADQCTKGLRVRPDILCDPDGVEVTGS